MENTLNVHDNHLGKFETVSHRVVDINNPNPGIIDIKDIAHALSQINRFGGHTIVPYSVAEHSMLVAALVPEGMKLEALLHDATEAYIGDVIKPLKNILGIAYAKIELQFEDCIITRFGLHRDKLDSVKIADIQALELEHSAYKLNNANARFEIDKKILTELGNGNIDLRSRTNFLTLFNRYYAQR